MRDHKDLEVWKHSMELVTEVYSSTTTFPKEETYGLTNQIRRSAVSIPSNIAEGASRQTTKEFVQFLYIALASAAELETQIIIATNLGYLVSPDSLQQRVTSARKMLNGLIRHYRTNGDAGA